jgi:hypothetical protein
VSAKLAAVSGFQLTASLVASLAWPVVLFIIVALVWVKRTEILGIIGGGSVKPGRPLKRIRAGPLELEWDKLIESTAVKVEAIGASHLSLDATKSAGNILSSSPAAAVLEGFARVETSLRNLLKKANKPGSGSIVAMSQGAAGDGLISQEVFDAIYNLYRLRNDAAHRVGEADISDDQAREYLQLADSVLTAIKQAADNIPQP